MLVPFGPLAAQVSRGSRRGHGIEVRGPALPAVAAALGEPVLGQDPQRRRCCRRAEPGGTSHLRGAVLGDIECLVDQAGASLDLVDACAGRLAALPPGPLSARLPKVFKVPEGHAYAWTENPLGINGYYLVSWGGKMPWRLKLRSASFNNIQVLGELLPGHLIADMVAILGSMFFVVGDIDK